MGRRVIGRQADGFLKFLDGFIVLTLPEERDAEVVVGFVIDGFKKNDLLIFSNSLVGLAILVQVITQIEDARVLVGSVCRTA